MARTCELHSDSIVSSDTASTETMLRRYRLARPEDG